MREGGVLTYLDWSVCLPVPGLCVGRGELSNLDWSVSLPVPGLCVGRGVLSNLDWSVSLPVPGLLPPPLAAPLRLLLLLLGLLYGNTKIKCKKIFIYQREFHMTLYDAKSGSLSESGTGQVPTLFLKFLNNKKIKFFFFIYWLV